MMVNLNQEDLNVSHAYIDFTFIVNWSVNFTSVFVFQPVMKIATDMYKKHAPHEVSSAICCLFKAH